METPRSQLITALSGVDEFTIDQRGVLRNNPGVLSVSFSPCTVVVRNTHGGDTLIFHRCKKNVLVEYNLELLKNFLWIFFFLNQRRYEVYIYFANLTNLTDKFFILCKMCLVLQG